MSVSSNPSTVTLGELVATTPGAARVLDGYGLDYCCHGERLLADAAREAGLDPDQIQEAIAGSAVKDDVSWASLSAPDLADHIVATHHAYLHEELPLLDALAEKVSGVHGERHPELARVRALVAEIVADLSPHLAKEENVLFPAIHELAAGRNDFPFGPIDNPVRMMLIEHDRAGELLSELREAANQYSVPADACGSYQSLYERLEALEHDTHVHIHKENHTLFPAAVAMGTA